MRRDSRPEKGAARKISDGERRLYLQARQLLPVRSGSTSGLDQVEADAWIEAQLAPP